MKKFNLILAIIISLLTVSFSIMFIFSDKKEFSENEFRYLEKKPVFSVDRLLNGKFISSVENYTNDHFPFRDFWVYLRSIVNIGVNQKLINNVYIAKDGFLINRFIEPKNTQRIIKNLNKFYENNKDINMQMMIVPTQTSIYEDKLPKNNINADEVKVINYYRDNLSFPVINIYNDLLNYKNKYQLFYKTDHHWTSYGAYVGYQAYLKNNNIDSYDINDFKIEEVSKDFLGTLYSKVFVYKDKDSIVKFSLDNDNFTIKHTNRTTNSFYEDKYLDTKDKYSYFLGNNEALIEITNNNLEEDNNILVIKDSFANCMIPLLAYHYKNIYVIDPRYYNLKITDFIKDNNIKNVLILYNINTIDTDTGITNIR